MVGHVIGMTSGLGTVICLEV